MRLTECPKCKSTDITWTAVREGDGRLGNPYTEIDRCNACGHTKHYKRRTFSDDQARRPLEEA